MKRKQVLAFTVCLNGTENNPIERSALRYTSNRGMTVSLQLFNSYTKFGWISSNGLGGDSLWLSSNGLGDSLMDLGDWNIPITFLKERGLTYGMRILAVVWYM